MRCEEHGLAAGPSGQCVVCLRVARARAQRLSRRLSVGFIVSVLVMCGALLASRAMRAPVVIPRAERSATPAAGTAAPTVEERSQPPTVASAAANEPANGSAANGSAADASTASAGVTSAALVSSASAAPAPAPTARVATNEEVQRAYHATPVLMFSTTWCPHCNRARQFFQTNGVSVVDRDIDADPSANAELRRRIGRPSIPLIVVDGQQLQPGFSERETMQAIAASVQRRTGAVTSLRLVSVGTRN